MTIDQIKTELAEFIKLSEMLGSTTWTLEEKDWGWELSAEKYFADLHKLTNEPEEVAEARASFIARRLERERDEALAKLSAVFQWINRNHPDGFIDSLTHLQNLERVSDVQHDRFDRLERERDLAHDQLSRICKEGFGNQDTIGLEPADDYVLRKLADAEAELSVSNGERDHYRRENAEMREAINEVSKRLQSIQLNDIFEETMRYNAALALAKLKPFLK
jgi:hypothetical protein